MTGNGQGTAVITTAGYAVKSFADPARPGETLILWGTGLGPVDGNDAAAPVPANSFPNTEVWIGGQSAAVSYAGRSGCCAGLDQVVFQVPSKVSGCFVPVAVRAGSIVSNFLTLPVAAQAGACADAIGFPADLLARAVAKVPITTGVIATGPIPILQMFGFPFRKALAQQLSVALRMNVSEKDLQVVLSRHAAATQKRAVLDRYRLAAKAAHLSGGDLLKAARDFTKQGAGGSFTQLAEVSDVISQFSFSSHPRARAYK